jgi:hypothetical protein
LLDELKELPVVLGIDSPVTARIASIVDKLMEYRPIARDLLNPNGVEQTEIDALRKRWERELDESVYDLYGLSEEQRDLVRDFCEITLPFFYKPLDCSGSSVAIHREDPSWIFDNYINVFARRWNAYLPEDLEIRAHVFIGAHETMIGVEFFPSDKSDCWSLIDHDYSWAYVLEQMGENLSYPSSTSQIITEGVVYSVSDDSLIVIKRNEKRFWTRSIAREDAEITLFKRMIATDEKTEVGTNG